MAADIDHVIDATHDPEVAVRVAPGAVAGKIDVLDLRPILLSITFIVAPDGSEHRRPGTRNYEITAFGWTNRLAVARHDVGFDAGKRFRRRAGFGRRRTGERADHDRAGFRLPPGVHNGTTALADDFAIPHPGFGIDRLANGAEQAQAGKIVLQRPVLAPLDESANGSRRGVKNIYAMTLDDAPEAIRFGIVRRAFVHQHRRAV